MLKRLSNYYTVCDDKAFINEFGDIFYEVRYKKKADGANVWRYCLNRRTINISSLVKCVYKDLKLEKLIPYSRKSIQSVNYKIYEFKDFYRIEYNSKVYLLLKESYIWLREYDKELQKSCGYKIFNINKKKVPVHVIVYTLFKGNIPKGCVIHHINFDKVFNYYNNLDCLTREEHCYIHHTKLG